MKKTKVLFVGIEKNGAVSKIMKEAIKSLPTDSIEIFYFGVGNDKNDANPSNNFFTVNISSFLPKVFIKIKSFLLKTFKYDTYLAPWEFVYRKLIKCVRNINPDVIIATSGPFYYIKASYEAAKRFHKKLSLIFFDPFLNNYKICDKKRAIIEATKWCNYASKILYDVDTNPPLNNMPKNKTYSFHIPIFDKPSDAFHSKKIIYGGSFYPGFREPDTIINFLNKQDNSPFTFEIYTGPKDAIRIRNSIDQNNVDVHRFTSDKKYEDICSNCLAMIVIGNAKQEATMPSKVLEAIGFKKPIIGINFVDEPYYIKKYPFFLNTDKKGADLQQFLFSIDYKALSAYNIYSNYPERHPNVFCNKIINCIFDD